MKKYITAIIVMFSIFIALETGAYADSSKCKILSSRALSYAKSRDEGVSLDSLTTSIDAVAEIGGVPEGDKIASEQIALLVFTRFKDLSPEQTQKQFFSDCVTANR